MAHSAVRADVLAMVSRGVRKRIIRENMRLVIIIFVIRNNVFYLLYEPWYAVNNSVCIGSIFSREELYAGFVTHNKSEWLDADTG